MSVSAIYLKFCNPPPWSADGFSEASAVLLTFLTSRAFYKDFCQPFLLPGGCVFVCFFIQTCLGSIFFLLPFQHSHTRQHWTLRRDCTLSKKPQNINLRCNPDLAWHVASVYTCCVDAPLLHLQGPGWLLTYLLHAFWLLNISVTQERWRYDVSLFSSDCVYICSVPWQSHNANSMFNQNMKPFWECKQTHWNKCCHVKSELLNTLPFFLVSQGRLCYWPLCCFVVQQFRSGPLLHNMRWNISLPLLVSI